MPKNELLLRKLQHETFESPGNAQGFFNLAVFLDDDEEDLSAALSAYEKAVAINPHFHQAHFYLGILHARMHNFDEAVSSWKKIADSDWNLQFEEVDYLNRPRIVNIARAELENYYNQDPQNPTVKTNAAIANLALGYLEKSKNLLEELIKEDPQLKSVNYYLGYIHLLKKEPELAIPYFKRESQIRPNFIPSLFSLAQSYCEIGRIIQAIQILQEILKKKPSHIKAHFLLGLCYSKQGKYPEAIVAFEKTLTLAPKFAQANYEIGLIHEKQYALDNAISKYLIAIQQNSNYKEAYFHLGITYKNLGKAALAITHFNKVLELDPGDGEGHYYTGETYMQLGKFEEAAKEYTAATMLNPNHAYAHYSLGRAYFKLNRLEEAVNAYQKALEINPKDTFARNALGMTFFREGQLTLAMEQFKKVLEINPLDPYSHYYLGAACFKLQHFEDAINSYQKASELNPHSAYARFSLGASLSRRGDFERAVEQFQKASELIPSSESDLALFSTLQLLAIIGMEHAQQGQKVRELYTDLESAYLDTVRALAKAIDARDTYTQFHSDRVSKISARLARQLNLKEEEIKIIEVAGYLHDIGKLGIPDKILLKSSDLTEEERNTINSHPFIGSKILEGVRLPWDIIPLIKHHHEHLDGSGYPKKLKKDEIPPGAKIIGLADYFDALTTDRPYRKAMTIREATIELEKVRDKYYESSLIDSFFKIIDEIPKILKDVSGT